ncbi:preprotein translocase subunit SecY [Taibaiella koreensis]|uniref:preprotein translocase subunit SecY n=1 Tax=Taibaiella koreensis TaxID=1268548 RepID=UPI000E59F6B8|nr:preprotein translocase subunit SecY [Taibaiella koreensis]
MKKLIETLKNIWSIEELRKRILFTLGLILVYRVGSYIVLPGINPLVLGQSQSQEGLLGLINMFAGGAFGNASIFALGVMPYISASIFMQLAGIVIPQFAKMQKEESGRNKMNQYTRFLTVLVTVFQASAYIAYLRTQTNGAIVTDGLLFYVSTIVVLTAGTLFVMYLGEKITDKGIGNGTSMIIMVGILARLPHSLVEEFTSKQQTDKLLFFLVELAVFVAVIIGLVLLTQGVRRIPLNYARRIVGTNAAKEIGGSRNFIPLKVNSAGVMPIIFAQALMFIPAMVAGFATGEDSGGNNFMRSLSDHTSLWYNVIYAVLVIAFTYFYTALIFNPTEMAENLKRNNSFIPGIKPGQPTADYIGAIMDRITLPGAVFLAAAGILPGIAALCGVTSGFASFFGGTSMLIGVGVVLDTLQQIESHLLMRHYDGLMKTGRISGRQPVAI